MKAWTATATILVCASVASAADLETEVGELQTALQARIDAGAGGKELRLFNKVGKKLAKAPVIDVKALSQVLGTVGKSGTADVDVLNEAADVLQCLCEVVQNEETLVLEIALTIPNSKFQEKVEAKVDAANAKLTLAKTFAESNPTKATKLLVGAYAKYLKAGKTANKLFAKAQPKAPPQGFSFSDQFLINNSSKPQNLREVTLRIEFLDEFSAVIGSAGGKATDLLPENFKDFNNRIFPNSFYDFGRYLEALFQTQNPPQGTFFFRGTMTFEVGKFAPFGLPLNNVPISNFYLPE